MKTRFINAKAVREYALALNSAQARGFTRVSASFLTSLDAAVANLIAARVRSHPSVGKTLMADETPTQTLPKGGE